MSVSKKIVVVYIIIMCTLYAAESKLFLSLSPLTAQQVEDYFASLESDGNSKRRRIDSNDDINLLEDEAEEARDELVLGIPYTLVDFDPNKLSAKYPEQYNNSHAINEDIKYIDMDHQGHIKRFAYQPAKTIATWELNGCFSFALVITGESGNNYAFLGHYAPMEKYSGIDKVVGQLQAKVKEVVGDDTIVSTHLVCLTIPNEEQGVDLNTIGHQGKEIGEFDIKFITDISRLFNVFPTVALYYERPEDYFRKDIRDDFRVTLSSQGSYWEYFGDNYVKHYF